MPITFPSNPSNADEYTFNGRTYTYNAARGVWLGSRGSSSSAGGGGTGGGVTTYATVAELPLNGNTNGDLAFVEETDKLYLSNDNGWFNIPIINSSPTITQGGAGSYVLATDGTPTVITLTATDPEEVPLTWSYSVTSGALGTTATVSQADNVFTITPGTTDPTDAGTFELTFSVTDGTNIVNDVNTFTLSFTNNVWYGDRGLHMGGLSSNVIQYFDITTLGNAINFGTLGSTVYTTGACSNATYALNGGGYISSETDIIEYFAISSTGNSTSFGTLTVGRYATSASSNGTYGLWHGGATVATPGGLDVIDYVTIASPSNATDFGNMTVARSQTTSFANSTYSVTAGGRAGTASGADTVNTIDYVTIATPSNSSNFGNLFIPPIGGSALEMSSSTSDDTYGIIAGGRVSVSDGDYKNYIQYVTIDTPSNALDFGDLTIARAETGGCGNGTRGVFSGGFTNNGGNNTYNTIDYITIASPGNAQDFGDLLQPNRLGTATSGSPS